MSQTQPQPINSKSKDANMWAMILHLSQLATYMVPILGILSLIHI